MSNAQKERERQALKSRNVSLELANVTLPPVRDKELLESCRTDLHLFLQECFPFSTGLRPFGDGQKQAIALIEDKILHGGRLAQAFPRGFAKTSISARAAIWAVLFSHRSYVPVFAASEENAKNLVDGIKMELEQNDILLGMFPALECIRALEGKAQRVHSQHIGGELTHMRWTADRIVLPTVPGFDASGNVLQAKAMRSARGLQYTTPGGEVLRPDFAILDDIQTDEDATSPLVIRKIVDKVKKSVLRSGGHSKTLSAVMNCTVIQPFDVAETFLDDPGWQSVRYKMVLSFPDNMEIWETQYRDILLDFSRDDPSGQRMAAKQALEFYQSHRTEMDQGARVSWEWAYAWGDDDPLEVSAIQHALNIKLMEGDSVFLPECQNEPIRITDSTQLQPNDVLNKITKVSAVPQEAQHLVAFIDVQANLLFYTVGAFDLDYTGSIIQIGAFPEQQDAYFSLDSLRPTLDQAVKGDTTESQIYNGLQLLVEALATRTWIREDGMKMTIGKILIDSGYKRPTVEMFCRNFGGGQLVMPARGIYVGARNVSFDEKDWSPKRGEVRGNQWEFRKTSDGAGVNVLVDTNYWKSFVWDRFQVGIGTPSAWRVNAIERKRVAMFADQVCAEYPTRTEGRGRELDEWQLVPGRRDNHYFDCCVGMAVAANILGCRLPSADKEVKLGGRKRVKFRGN